MGNKIYYAAMEQQSSGAPSYFAGAAQSVDLCSVSACFPHVVVYPESGQGGSAEKGSVSCPSSPSASSPCTLTIQVKAADVGGPKDTSILESLGSYAFASSHTQAPLTNAQAQADNVPLEIDGVCCINFGRKSAGAVSPQKKKSAHKRKHRRKTHHKKKRHRQSATGRASPHFTG